MWMHLCSTIQKIIKKSLHIISLNVFKEDIGVKNFLLLVDT